MIKSIVQDKTWIPRNLSFRYIHCTSQFTPKMKANAEPRLLSSLVWIDFGVVVSKHILDSFLMKQNVMEWQVSWNSWLYHFSRRHNLIRLKCCLWRACTSSALCPEKHVYCLCLLHLSDRFIPLDCISVYTICVALTGCDLNLKGAMRITGRV